MKKNYEIFLLPHLESEDSKSQDNSSGDSSSNNDSINIIEHTDLRYCQFSYCLEIYHSEVLTMPRETPSNRVKSPNRIKLIGTCLG